MFLEPKVLYRAAVDMVPEGDYMLPLGQADIVQEGSDIALVGWGTQMRVLQQAADSVASNGISCEIIDLQTLLPWDVDTVQRSVEKTGRLLISHEVSFKSSLGGNID